MFNKEKRIELNEKLVNDILKNNTRHVYFQPPENMLIEYPCIIYERHDINNIHADDDVYIQPCRYRIIVIDFDPDSIIVERMSKFKTARHMNHYVSDKLNHDTFEIYY